MGDGVSFTPTIDQNPKNIQIPAPVPVSKTPVTSVPAPRPNDFKSSKGKTAASTTPSQTYYVTPLILRSSVPLMDGIIPGDPPEPHQVAIDKVSTALLSPSSVDSDQKMSDSKDEDSEMSEYEEPEEPDNSMTLDEYQNGI